MSRSVSRSVSPLVSQSVSQSVSPLCESIRNVHPYDYYDYIDRLKKMIEFYDVKDVNNVTPLFLCLQYSVINERLMCLFVCICTHKHQYITSFDDFNKNMEIIKKEYPSYYEELKKKNSKCDSGQ